MFPSVSNPSSFSNNSLMRAGQAVVRQDSAVAAAEGSTLRAIGSVPAGNRQNGISNSQRQDDRDATELKTGARDNDRDFAAAAADLMVQKNTLRASVAVLKTTDHMVGSLLDVMG